MSNLLKSCAVASLSLTVCGVAHAAVIDPELGLSGSVGVSSSTPGVDFFLPVDEINGMDGNEATITAPAAATLDFTISDGGTTGDAYALELNGELLTPTGGDLGEDTRGPDASSFFSAVFEDIAIPAGTSTFGIFYTDTCCTSISINSFAFTGIALTDVTPPDGPPSGGGPDTPAPIPVPAAFPLLLGGLAVLRLMPRRRQS